MGDFVKSTINSLSFDYLKDLDLLINMNDEDIIKISKNELNQVAEDSIIRETIKKIEINKYIELNENSEIVEDIIKDFYKSAGLQSLNEFELYLIQNGINLDLVKYKINIETNILINNYKYIFNR